MAAGLLATMPAWAQAPVVPEKVEPRQGAPGAGGDPGLATPRSETAVPDDGVVKPPPVGGSSTVIRPPAVGTMPVIPPPGSPGGDPTVVPK